MSSWVGMFLRVQYAPLSLNVFLDSFWKVSRLQNFPLLWVLGSFLTWEPGSVTQSSPTTFLSETSECIGLYRGREWGLSSMLHVLSVEDSCLELHASRL